MTLDDITILQGNALDVLKTLRDESVHCAVTSPPYLGLRKYPVPPQVWPACAYKPMAGLPELEFPEWEGHLGNEPSPEMYVAHLVIIFREMRRVLRSDGVFWLNLGDSYSFNRGSGSKSVGGKQATNRGSLLEERRVYAGLAEGDMIGVPWRVAFALQADGWVLRSDPIWAKTTWMPDSGAGPRWERHKIKTEAGRVECPGCEKCDPNGGMAVRNGSWKPTKAHEYVFMFTKTNRYFADGLAVRQPAAKSSLARIVQKNFANQTGGGKDYGNGVNTNNSARKALENFALNPGHNLTTVWRLKPGAFEGKHFATFPVSLPDLCLRASVPEGGVCSACGKPYLPVIDKAEIGGDDHDAPTGSLYPENSAAGRMRLARQVYRGRLKKQGQMGKHGRKGAEQDEQSPMFRVQLNMNAARAAGGDHDNPFPAKTVTGFKQACACEGSRPVAGTVLDPFAGAGTTLLAAARLGLAAVGIELSAEFAELAWKRLTAPKKKRARPQPLADSARGGQLSLFRENGDKP